MQRHTVTEIVRKSRSTALERLVKILLWAAGGVAGGGGGGRGGLKYY